MGSENFYVSIHGKYKMILGFHQTHLAGAVEYTNCTLQSGECPTPHESHGCDTKQSDGETPVILELWGMQSTL